VGPWDRGTVTCMYYLKNNAYLFNSNASALLFHVTV